jgi:hypothetical protein
MNETVTATLHGANDTIVQSSYFQVGSEWFTSFEVGSVTIFAPPELLRRIAEEATKAALIAEGWSRPTAAATIPPPPPADAPTPSPLTEMKAPAGLPCSAAGAEFPF